MHTNEFASRVKLGMNAYAAPPWQDPLSGRVVSLTRPRYGAWIRDSRTGSVKYTDCVWIEKLEEE